MIDGEELELFEKSLRHATSAHTGPALDGALAELGWSDALADDPRAAVSTLFELQGAAVATSSALDQVLAAALGLVADEVAVVLPPLGRRHPPGDVVDGTLTVHGLATMALGRRSAVVVLPGDEHVVVDPGDLTRREVSGLDPASGIVEVSAVVAAVTARSTTPAAWDGAVAAGQRALAHELVGASRAMLQMARDHAVERIQFGRPIAEFQAVRHRLADGLVAIEEAGAALGAAWDDGSPFTAALAKAIAGRSARTVTRHCQQVLAGIGFTAEHPFHRYLRRTMVLDRLLGDARSLTRELGEQLLRTRQVPGILPL